LILKFSHGCSDRINLDTPSHSSRDFPPQPGDNGNQFLHFLDITLTGTRPPPVSDVTDAALIDMTGDVWEAH
jgi:hypothetical protein